MMFRTMVIAGVGLIGGSLALAARERGLVERVVGYGRNEKTLRRGKKIGILDQYFLRAEDFPEDADFLVLATPVSAIAPLTRSFLPRLDAGCLISDVGSVKRRVVADMDRLLKGGRPSHRRQRSMGPGCGKGGSVRPPPLHHHAHGEERTRRGEEAADVLAPGGGKGRVDGRGAP